MLPQEQIQEIQILEQNLQSLLMQKQAFQLELNETDSALHSLEKADDEVYKITGQILIKADKLDLKKELAEKKKLLELRLKAIENQESKITERIDRSRSAIQAKDKEQK